MTIKFRHGRIDVRAIGIAVLVMLLVCSGLRPTRAADGDLDQSFGKGGIVVSDLDTQPGREEPFSEGRAIAIQPDGRIVVAAQTHLNGSTFFVALARYNPDGSLDATFGSGGKVTIMNTWPPNAIAIQADGKIVTGSLAGLMRFTADGSLDATFGSGGKVSTGKPDISKLALLPDGKIIAAGTATGPFLFSFAVLRFNADGSPDASFGVGGQATADFPGHSAGLNSLAVQPDGKIIAGGATQPGGVGVTTPSFAALARFNTDGTLDAAFGSSGLVVTPDLGVDFRAVTVLDGGKIVATGGMGPAFFGAQGKAFFGAARYNPDGSLDTTFGNGGFVTSPFFPEPDTNLITGAIDPYGKFVVAGEAQFGLAIARYNSDGTPDTGFGAGGTVITHVTDPNQHYPDTIRAIAFQADGQMVVTGDANDDANLVLARYNTESDFALSFSQANQTMTAGTKAKVTLNIAHRGGYAGNVTITPSDTSVLDIRISPNPVTTTDGSVTFKIKLRGDTPPGSYPLVFAGQSDEGLAHSTTLTLVVQ